jgi:glycosyltransferase involved in cell wall biosynthesis
MKRDERPPGPVLFLLSSLIVGGSEGKAVRVANELHRRGRDVHVAYLNPPTTLLAKLDQHIPVIHLGRKGKLSFAAIRTLRDYLRRAGISRVVCVNLYPLLYAQAARGTLPSATRPSVIQLVNRTEHVGRKARAAMLLYAPLLRRAEKIIFGCQAQLELWRARYRLDEARCHVIYNGVDERKFAAEGRTRPSVPGLRLDGTEFVIGTVGTLRKQKNHAELIAALAHLQVPHGIFRAIIVGEGPERSSLEQQIRELGLEDRVSLLGELEDVRPILEIIDVFVLTSITETFSNAALEAMSMGRAVILSDTGGAREMVEHGTSGYVYPPGDIATLAALLERLARDAETRRVLGAGARSTVLEKFTNARMLVEYEQSLS